MKHAVSSKISDVKKMIAVELTSQIVQDLSIYGVHSLKLIAVFFLKNQNPLDLSVLSAVLLKGLASHGLVYGYSKFSTLKILICMS